MIRKATATQWERDSTIEQQRHYKPAQGKSTNNGGGAQTHRSNELGLNAHGKQLEATPTQREAF